MLDFGAIAEKTFDVRLPDGQELHLRQPRKATFSKLTGIKDRLDGAGDTEKQIREVLELAAILLSENLEGKTFTPDEVEEMLGYGGLFRLITEYSKFTREVWNDPN